MIREAVLVAIFCVFSAAALNTFASMKVGDAFTCSDGSHPVSRFLIISQQKFFMFPRLIESSTDQRSEKRLPRLSVNSGLNRVSRQCTTVIETPQIFSYMDVIDTVERIVSHCFDKIFVMIDASESMSHHQIEMVEATINLMESVYVESIWENIEFIILDKGTLYTTTQMDQTQKKIFIYQPNYLLKSSLVWKGPTTQQSSTFEPKTDHFLTKSGIPWIGGPNGIGIRDSTFNLSLSVFIQSESFDVKRLAIKNAAGHHHPLNFPLTLHRRRNDIFEVEFRIENHFGNLTCEYNGIQSVNSVNLFRSVQAPSLTLWSSWTKCSQIDGITTRQRSLLKGNSKENHGLKETRPCYCSDLTHLPRPRILLIGRTGVGKSSLGNQLLGGHQAFAAGHGTESKTEEVDVYTGNFLGVGQCITLIDTPGGKDSKGRDYDHAIKLQKILKNKLEAFEVILLLRSGTNPRIDAGTTELMRWFEAVLGKDMWKHVMIEVTFWPHKKYDVFERQKNRKTNEKSYSFDIRRKLKNVFNMSTGGVPIPVTFIDPVAEIFQDPCIDGSLEAIEKQKFEYYIGELASHIRKTTVYPCKDLCLAPDDFFKGGPLVASPVDRLIKIRKGETLSVEWQIWTGVSANETSSYDLLINNELGFQKKNGQLTQLVSMANKKELNGLTFKLIESNKIPRVISAILSISLDRKMIHPPILNFTVELKNRVEALSSVEVMVARDATVGQWSSWTQCSISCINSIDTIKGVQVRNRQCFPAKNGGQTCGKLLGMPESLPDVFTVQNETRFCSGGNNGQIVHCPVHLTWSQWTPWGSCSATCGVGKRSRARTCTNGKYGGALCRQSSETVVENCDMKRECPRNCRLSNWNNWSPCSKSCNPHTSVTGLSFMVRTKTILEEANRSGVSCAKMETKETRQCSVPKCPVDGVWSAFTAYSACSKTCGDGQKVAHRHCIGPQFSGKPCKGDNRQYAHCKMRECPVDCVYTNWSGWDNCDKKCNSGTQRRRRSKTPPRHGGKGCHEPIVETRKCNTHRCPGGGSFFINLG